MTIPEVDQRTVRRVADMHAIYRMFDEDGRLLYVGRTGNAGRRFGDHSAKRWFPLVETIKLEWFATQAAAVVAERRAIQGEHPRYNIAATGKTSPRSRSDGERLGARYATARRRSVRRVLDRPLPSHSPTIPSGERTELLNLLSAEAGTTISRASGVLGVSKWTARVWLDRLRDEGIARVSGIGRGARWHLADGDES